MNDLELYYKYIDEKQTAFFEQWWYTTDQMLEEVIWSEIWRITYAEDRYPSKQERKSGSLHAYCFE